MLETRDKLGLDDLQDTDLIPMINYAWNHSFARKTKNQKAISERGWNPLNRNLLMDRDLRATMTQREKCRQYNIHNNVVLPDKFFTDHNSSDSGGTTVSSTSCSMFSVNNQSTINIKSN